MPAEPETERGSWLAYAATFSLLLPVLYLLGLGPVARLAFVWPEAGTAVLWVYAPIFELSANDCCQTLLNWYVMLWLPDGEGIVVPIYSSTPDCRARELVDTSERLPDNRESREKKCSIDQSRPAGDATTALPVFYLRREFEVGPKPVETSYDADIDSLEAVGDQDLRTRELIYESENLRRIPGIWEKVWFLDSPEFEDAKESDKLRPARGGVD